MLLVEAVVSAVARGTSDWLPGSFLCALAQGGNASVSFSSASLLGAGYVAVALAASFLVFQRRDITDEPRRTCAATNRDQLTRGCPACRNAPGAPGPLSQLSRLREAVLPLEEASPEVLRPARDLDREQLVAALRATGGPPLLLAEFLQAEQRLGRVSGALEPARAAIMILAAFLGVQTSPLAGRSGLDDQDVRAFAGMVCHGLAGPE